MTHFTLKYQRLDVTCGGHVQPLLSGAVIQYSNACSADMAVFFSPSTNQPEKTSLWGLSCYIKLLLSIWFWLSGDELQISFHFWHINLCWHIHVWILNETCTVMRWSNIVQPFTGWASRTNVLMQVNSVSPRPNRDDWIHYYTKDSCFTPHIMSHSH